MKEGLERVSIVIPTHNRAAPLVGHLPSYLAQGCREVIVVDDASDDDTVGAVSYLCETNPSLRLLRHPVRLGAPACRNSGAAATSGDYVLFGEDDLFFAEDYAEKLLACAERHDADVTAGRLIYILHGEDSRQALARCDRRQGKLLNKRLLIGDLSLPGSDDVPFMLLHACSLVRRETWERLRYDEGYLVNGYREESDFYVRCAKSGGALWFCPGTSCYHLPRELVTAGGQWRGRPWRYRYWAVRNNVRFLRRHQAFLKGELGIREGLIRLVANQMLHESLRMVGYIARQKLPALHAAMARRE